MFQEIDKLIEDREESFPANLLKARDLLLEITKKDDKNADAFARLSHAMYWLGEFSESSADQEKYFGEGVEHGKKAVELAPESLEGNFWYATCMGSHGLVRGIMSSLFYLSPIEKHGKKSMELDEKYFLAAPLRLMGRFYHQAPPWPLGSGDTSKAIKTLERAVEMGPEFLQNHVYLAEVYISKGRKDDAKKLLEHVLSRPEPARNKLRHAKAQKDARIVLEKL